MKKLAIIIIVVVFITGMLASCNKSVCPAYVMEKHTEQVQNNS